MMSKEMSFWDHLDVLRGCLLRILAVVVVAAVVSFCLKEQLFDIVLAPCHSDFVSYRALNAEPFELHLINTGLAEQMMVHLKVALSVGIVVASPYIIYVLYGFVAPALYDKERRYSVSLITSGYIMFVLGVIVNYLLLFPLTVRFLGLYQVSNEVENMLSISSYVDTLLMMSIAFGLVFEIPVLSWLMAKLGFLRATWMTRYRRHAIVAILVMSAVITPTPDALTLLIVSLPMWLLYEISIYIVRMTNGLHSREEQAP